MAFVVLNGIQYLSLYAGRAGGRDLGARPPRPAAGIACGSWSTHAGGRRGLPALCGWRLATVFLVLLDDRRERVTVLG